MKAVLLQQSVFCHRERRFLVRSDLCQRARDEIKRGQKPEPGRLFRICRSIRACSYTFSWNTFTCATKFTSCLHPNLAHAHLHLVISYLECLHYSSPPVWSLKIFQDQDSFISKLSPDHTSPGHCSLLWAAKHWLLEPLPYNVTHQKARWVLTIIPNYSGSMLGSHEAPHRA